MPEGGDAGGAGGEGGGGGGDGEEGEHEGEGDDVIVSVRHLSVRFKTEIYILTLHAPPPIWSTVFLIADQYTRGLRGAPLPFLESSQLRAGPGGRGREKRGRKELR